MNRNKWKYQSIAFSKNTPTAFIVESPFQLLCALNAIADFEITEYRIVLVLERNNIRNLQVISMLKSRHLDYDTYYMDDVSIDDILCCKISQSKIRYERVMLGEYLNNHILAIGGLYAAEHSVAVYMDDGAATIRILTGHSFNQNRHMAILKRLFRPKSAQRRKLQQIHKYWDACGMHDFGFYYTIYSDIKSRSFVTYPNKLDKLYPAASLYKKKNVILIIGAVTEGMATVSGITIAEYEGILWRKMRELKFVHSNQRIIYIPHGRDNNKNIKGFCELLQIEYTPIDMAVESYVISKNVEVTNIYGFSSTALYTLKLITHAKVTLWLIKNKFKTAWYSINEIAMYYRSHGIIIEEILYPQPSIYMRLCHYTKSLLNHIK